MLRRAACLLTFLLLGIAAQAQPAAGDGTRQPRILLLLDGSSSMLQPWNSTIRFKAAARVIAALMDSIYSVNAGVEFGLRVYGHQTASQFNDCLDSRQEVMFSKNNATQMSLRLASLRPFGVSPIAYSLKEAAENDLIDEVRNAYSVILITDGGESCGGDICDVVKNLIERKIFFKPYILSLVDYAPLKDQYACLGTYLQVANEKEIGTAIHRIVDAYRPLLSMPIMAVKLDTPPVTPKPGATTPVTAGVPAWTPDRTPMALLINPVRRPRYLSVSRPVPRPRLLDLPRQAPVRAPEPLAVRTPEAPMARLAAISARRRLPATMRRPAPARLAISRSVSVRPPEPLPVRTPEAALARITRPPAPRPFRTVSRPPSPRRLNIARTVTVRAPEPEPVRIPEAALARVRRSAALRPLRISQSRPAPRRLTIPRPELVAASKPEPVVAPPVAPPVTQPVKPPVVRRDTVAAVKPPATPPATQRPDTVKTSIVIRTIDKPKVDVPKGKPAPKPPVSNKPKEMEFTSQTEDAKETSLAILFTDGRGKFYASTPQLQLTDAVTGKVIKQFYRTVDPSGNPDPQVIPPGTYNLLVVGRSNMLMRRIVVEKDKMNKVIVKVSNGSLRFRYEDAPDRPVTEFDAIVNIRFEPGPTVKQRCTAELEYAPGNYYIEINTMPVSRFNTDIDFGAITEIQIPEPGYVQFTNTAPRGNVSLFTPLGNKFVRFHGLRITGNPDDQRLRLRPGAYEVRWVKNPNMPFATETIERFQVRSNSVTEIELP